MKIETATCQKILHQRCVHHITSLYIRNITISFPSNPATTERVQADSFLYFTLHPNVRSSQDELFTSDVVPYSSNPSWSNFIVPCPNCKLTSVAVRLWIGSGDGYMPALQWELSLKSLRCIGDTLDSNKMTFHSNSVVLGMHKSHFASSTAVTCHERPESVLCDTSNLKTSYSKISLHRILLTLSETQAYKFNAASIFKKTSLLRKSCNPTITNLKKELELIQLNIDHLKSLLKRERVLLRHENEEAKQLMSTIENQENELKKSREVLAVDRLKYWESHHIYLEKKKRFSELSSQLATRRHSLLSELFFIFPIVTDEDESRDSSPKKNAVIEPLLPRFKICNIKLPDSENFRQRDDLNTSVALGFTAQVVVMISHFLLVPLRYPIILKGSSSSIMDLVTEKMSDRERVLPLSVKSKKERFLFGYGVFLLNKNIAHLRYVCGIGTSDLRRTLDNIHSLLEERLGTRLALPDRFSSIDFTEQDGSSASFDEQNKLGENCLHQSDCYPFTVSSSKEQYKRSESSSSFVSVFKRMDSRSQELSSLRNELFGLNEVDELSSVYHRPKRTSSDFLFEASRSRKSLIDTPHRVTFLTGLEPSNNNFKEVKLSAAAARAELLGRKADQEKRRIIRNGSADSANGRQLFPIHDNAEPIPRLSIVETVPSQRNSNSCNNSSFEKHQNESCSIPDSSLAEPCHVSARKLVLSDRAASTSGCKPTDHVPSFNQSENDIDLC